MSIEHSAEPTANRSQQDETAPAPTAAILLIGNELLSGRTQDTNAAYMAKGLARHGIRLTQVRIVPDNEAVMIDALHALTSANTYVFTTGGIGPTHDDITADTVAKAFAVDIDIHAEAEARLLAYWSERDIKPNADRLRMARIPEGAALIDNPVSVAPGFTLGNVYVMAGVPSIMQAMFDSILPQLKRGAVIQSVSVLCNLGEGTIAAPLRALQAQYAAVDLGSYPGKKDGKYQVSLVARSADTVVLKQVELALNELVLQAGGQVLDV